jgi:hypothetical protein
LKAIKFIYIFLFFLLWFSPGITIGQVSFEAVCNVREVFTDEPFELTFELRNSKIKLFTPPTFNGLQAQGPKKGKSISYINGNSATIQSRTYYIKAVKPGRYKIGPAKVITHNGTTIRSKGLIIKVVAKNSNINNEFPDKVFLRTELSTNNAVTGEQVTVDINIYTQVGIEHVEISKEPSFGNVYYYYLRSFSGESKTKIIKGKKYTTQTLRRLVIFPSSSGVLIIEPAIVKVGIAENKGRGVFNPYRIRTFTLKSLPVELNIRDLNREAKNFSGVTGNYNMQAHVEKNTITSDNVLKLSLRIQGEGDIKQVLSPNPGVDTKYFDLFDPDITEEIQEGNRLLGGTKHFQYILSPKALGDFIIKPEFTYYNARLKRFISLDTIINIRVIKGSINLPDKEEKTEIKEFTEDMPEPLPEYKSPQTEAKFKQKNNFRFLGSQIFWTLSFLPLLFSVILFGWKYKEETQINSSASDQKKNNAASEAKNRLKITQKYLNEGIPEAFYRELSKTLLDYVSNKYNIPTANLTKKNVREQLSKQQINKNKIDRLIVILETCESALFSGMTKDESMEKIFQESSEFIDNDR